MSRLSSLQEHFSIYCSICSLKFRTFLAALFHLLADINLKLISSWCQLYSCSLGDSNCANMDLSTFSMGILMTAGCFFFVIFYDQFYGICACRKNVTSPPHPPNCTDCFSAGLNQTWCRDCSDSMETRQQGTQNVNEIMTNAWLNSGNESQPFTMINKMKWQGPQDTKQNNVLRYLTRR